MADTASLKTATAFATIAIRRSFPRTDQAYAYTFSDTDGTGQPRMVFDDATGVSQHGWTFLYQVDP